MAKTVTLSADTTKGCLLVDGYRIVGFPNNRQGRRAYDRAVRRGKGFMQIADHPPTDDDSGIEGE